MKRIAMLLLVCIMMVGIFSGCSDETGEEKSQEAQKNDEPKVVYITQTAPPNMIEQLKNKEIAGFIAWEPFNSDAIAKGYGKYLFKSEESWEDHPCCVVAKTSEFNDQKVLTAITWANLKAAQFINDPANKDKVLDYAVEFTGRDKAVVEEAIKNVDFVEYPSEEEFKKYYKNLTEGTLLKKSLQDIGFEGEDQFFASFFNKESYDKVVIETSKDALWKPEQVGQDKFSIGYISNDLHQLALYVAQKEGYYEEVGIVEGKNLEIKQYANGVDIMSAFNAKEIDLAYLGGAPATMKRLNDDIKIEIIAGANQEGSGLVVLPEKAEVTDLAGETIAVPGIGTVQYMLLEQELKKAGLKMQMK